MRRPVDAPQGSLNQLAVLRHQLGEVLKKMIAIVRPWRGFWMALDREDRQFLVVEAL